MKRKGGGLFNTAKDAANEAKDAALKTANEAKDAAVEKTKLLAGERVGNLVDTELTGVINQGNEMATGVINGKIKGGKVYNINSISGGGKKKSGKSKSKKKSGKSKSKKKSGKSKSKKKK